MKLSDIKGERVFDVVADIVGPIASIASDENAAAMFRQQELPEGMEPYQFFLSRVEKSLPPLMRTHKDELVTIMASIEGVDKSEYLEKITLGKLFADLTELVTDGEFVSFFG